MKLNNITEGMWRDISDYLNYNFNKISIATNKLEDIGLTENLSFKGVFESEALLKQEFPKPNKGDYAFVLPQEQEEDIKFIIYTATSYGIWEQTDGDYDPEVILKDYIEVKRISEIEDLENDIKDYLNNK